MNTSRRLLSGTFCRTIQFGLQVAVVFLFTPFIMRALGNQMYGSWILIAACVGYTALMDLGLSSGVARYISRASGQNDHDEINRVINTSLRLFLLIGAAVLLFTIIGAGLCWFAVNDHGEARALALTALFLGARLALKFPTRAFDGVLTSHLRYDLQVVATLTGFLSSYALIYFLLRQGHGIAAMAAAMFACSLAEYTLIIFFARRVFRPLRLAGILRNDSVRDSLFSYSWKTVLWQLANMLRFKVDSPVIAAFLGRAAIPPYAIGSQLNAYFYEFVTVFIGNLSPVFSRYESKGDYNAIREKFLMMTRISTVVSIFVGASITFYSRDFILRWMGHDFIGLQSGQLSYKVAIILSFGYTLGLMHTPTSSLLYGISKHQYGAIVGIFEGLLNLGLSILLIKPFGIYGVAMGTTIGLFISFIFVFPILSCRIIQLPCVVFYRDIGMTAFKSLAALAVYFLSVRHFLEPNYLVLLALGAVQLLLFLPAAFFLILRQDERKLLLMAVFKSRREKSSDTKRSD